jgi:hypothetical protein
LPFSWRPLRLGTCFAPLRETIQFLIAASLLLHFVLDARFRELDGQEDYLTRFDSSRLDDLV